MTSMATTFRRHTVNIAALARPRPTPSDDAAESQQQGPRTSSPPPPYSRFPTPRSATTGPRTSSTSTPGPPSLANDLVSLIYYSTPGLEIKDGAGRQLYHVSRFQIPNRADIVLSAGYDARGPQLAQAKFQRFADTTIYLGPVPRPDHTEWQVVRKVEASDFSVRGARFFFFPGPTGECWCWRKSGFLGMNHELREAGSERLVAVYIEYVGTQGMLKGRVEWERDVGEGPRVAGLVVLMALVGRAKARTNLTRRSSLAARR